ncbi:MAG: ABC transporter substrate-binding protein [Sphingomonadales bacterium]|nr:ABC transporter substrate-binding protein [Sphingomonadales bacterium]
MRSGSGRKDRHHPAIARLVDALEQRKLDRREFLRAATLLGMTAPMAYGLAARADEEGNGERAAPAGARRGGLLRVGMRIPALASPHTFSWVYDSNVVRQCNEYLTRTRPDGVTVPHLLDHWQPSDDLRSWTLTLKKGVKWSNGEALVAEHVIWNINRWLDPGVDSSVLALLKGFMLKDVDAGEKNEDGSPKITTVLWDANAIEKVDDLTIRLNGAAPQLAIPETLFHYPALILHPKDEGRWGLGSIGTGAFEPTEIDVGRKVTLKRRASYWKEGGYLDEIHFIDFGDDPAAKLTALASRQVDGLHDADIRIYEQVKGIPGIEIHRITTAKTAVARMKVGADPFKDARVRKAMKLAVDPAAVLRIAHRDLGAPGEHHHVCPAYPDYAWIEPFGRDVAAAKELLAEAGYPDGIKLELHCKKDPDWEFRACQAMVGQWAEAGITVKLNLMPSARYWEVWTRVPFGFTAWTHRPLAITTLALAYRTGAPWNESDYANPTFDELLTKAEGIVDLEQRKTVIAEIEKIMQEDGPIVQPLWRASYQPFTAKLKGYHPHPTEYYFFEDVWLEA